MSYDRVLAEFVGTPWAIQQEKLEAIKALLLMRARGERLTPEDIKARTGGKDSKRSVRSSGGVSVIPIYGVINHRMNMMSEMSGGTSIEQLTSQFRGALADPQIATIVFDVDSPGGGVSGVQELADEIFAARKQKQIIAQVNPLAASAAYWLAASAEQIVMTPSGAAGSIGVFTTHEDVSKALEKEGIAVTLISAGKFKTEGNQYEPLNEDAKAYMQKRVDEYMQSFVQCVARGRGVTAAAVKTGFGQGRVAGAQDALALGMVDRIATLDQTIEGLVGKNTTATAILSGHSSEKIHAATDQAPPSENDELDLPCTCPCEGCKTACTECTTPDCSYVNCSCENSGIHQARSHSLPAARAVETSATAETNKEVAMSTTATPASAAGENLLVAETQRVNTIISLCAKAGMPEKAAGFVREQRSLDTVSAELMDLMTKAAKPTAVADSGAQVHLSAKESRQYSMMAAIRGTYENKSRKGFEFEVSDQIAKKLGRETEGVFIPTNLRNIDRSLLSDSARQQFEATIATSGSGGNLVQTSILPEEFIDLLRNFQVVMALGAKKLTDLQGSIALPKQTGASTLYWTGENPGAAVTEADQTFGQVLMSPKQAMAQTAYSRQFLIQSSLDAEALLREDLALIFAIGFDSAAMIGTGASNQPKGIINQSGINTVAIGTNGGAFSYGIIVSAQTALETANVPITSPGLAVPPGTKGWLRNHAKLANTIGLPIWADDNTVGGWAAKSTMTLPQNTTKGSGTNLHTAIFGAWNNLVLAEWGALEIIADPYTQAGKGNVLLTGSMLVDVAVRYAQAFTVVSDIDTTAP